MLHACWQFLKSIRPSFEAKLPNQARKKLAKQALEDMYTATLEVVEDSMQGPTGNMAPLTISVDGHRDGNHRSVQTISDLRVGFGAFRALHYPRNRQHTGKHLAEVLAAEMESNKDRYIAVVADNTGNMLAMFEELEKINVWLFFLGCCVHIFDLMIEDIAKLACIKQILDDAHFIVSFIKRHELIHEDFRILQEQYNVRGGDLRLFPLTRFAYAYKMIRMIVKNWSIISCYLVKSPVFQASMARQKAKGQAGDASYKEHFRVKSLAANPDNLLLKLEAVHDLLSTLSKALHCLEGNNVPPSHVYPMYATVLDYVTNPPASISDALSEQTMKDVVDAVEARWNKGPRGRVGLKNDVLLATYGLDPAACAVSPVALNNTEVTVATKRCLKKLARGDQAVELMYVAQYDLFRDSKNVDSPPNIFTAEAEGSRANAKAKYDKVLSDMRDCDGAQGDVDNPVHKLIAALKVLPRPSQFWGVMGGEADGKWSKEQRVSHQAFCRSMSHLCQIVPHSCATERFGKGYKILHGAFRCHMGEKTLEKLLYVYWNYHLVSGLPLEASPSIEEYFMEVLSEGEWNELKV